jgi:hypothetical protein
MIMRRLIAGVVLLGLPAVLHAQQQQGAPTEARSSRPAVSPAEALGAVRGRLLLLVESQEAHFADHGTYTTSLTALHLAGKGQPRSPVVIDITHAARKGWRAAAWHSAHPNKSCVIFVGKIDQLPIAATKSDARKPDTTQEGQPVCDEP